MSDTGTFMAIVLIAIVLFIGLLLILTATALFFGRKAIQQRVARFLRPNPNDIQRDLVRLRNKFPNSSVDEVATKYIAEQAVLLGIVGFMTEVWGFFIPILGFTIDAGFTTLRQMRMVHVITALYGGNNQLDAEDMEIRYMAMVGVGTLLPRFILKFLAGEIPFVGGVINFGINWLVTTSIGKTAIGWNTGKSGREIISSEARRLKASALSAKEAAVHMVSPNVRQAVGPAGAHNQATLGARELAPQPSPEQMDNLLRQPHVE